MNTMLSMPLTIDKLCICCHAGDLSGVVSILRSGVVDINTPGKCGHTPLICAMLYNYPAIVRALLRSPGIRPDITYSNNGLTALHFACLNNSVGVIPVFGQNTIMSMLRIRDNDGDTPAMAAVRMGNIDCLKELDKYGGIAREDEKSLLVLARRYKHPLVEDYLKKRKLIVPTLTQMAARVVADQCTDRTSLQELEIPRSVIRIVSRLLEK